MANSLRMGIVDVKGPKRYSNGNGQGGDSERMYPKSELKSGTFLAGSTVYLGATPVEDGVALQKDDTDARGLAGKTKWFLSSDGGKTWEEQHLESEARYISQGGFGVGVHIDAEGSYQGRAVLEGYGQHDADWSIK